MKIIHLDLMHLRNEAHYEFFWELKEIFTEFPHVAALIGERYGRLLELIAIEGDLIDASRTSEYTEQIVEADSRRDRSIVGITSAVTSFLHHYDPAKVAAAHSLEIRLKDFHSLIEKKTYEEESAAVRVLIKDLQTTHAPQIALLELGGWVVELAAAQDSFDSFIALRDRERNQKPHEKLKNLRKQIGEVYGDSVAVINAHALIDADAECDGFIERLNLRIEYFIVHEPHRVRIDIAACQPAAIPQQTYTGHDCTPVPEDVIFVTSQGTVRLVLGKDFNLSYRHNVEAGVAECTLHGVGAYKGHKTITFIIARD